MATIIIKSGITDEVAQVVNGRLLVTGDGGGGGGNVNIFDSDGNPLTSVDGALKISGSFSANSGFDILTPGTPTQVPVGATSVTIIPANPLRVYAHVVNNTATPIFLQFGAAAEVGAGIPVGAKTFYPISGDGLWLGDVNAISSASSVNIDILEGVS